MTPQAVEFIVEACIQHYCARFDGTPLAAKSEDDLTGAEIPQVARLAVRMAVAWERAIVGRPIAIGGEPSTLPRPLFDLVVYNAERGTLDAPVMPKEEAEKS